MTGRARDRRFLHRFALMALAAAHFVVSAGIPLPTPRTVGVRKPSDRPFPCQFRPCGCATYEQCWAGDCCCFTLAEKLAWAKANEIPPPAAALAKAQKAKPKGTGTDCPHCDPTPASLTSCCQPGHPAGNDCCSAARPEPKPLPHPVWVSGLFAQKCKGEVTAGVGVLPVAVPPEPAFDPVAEVPDLGPSPLVDQFPAGLAGPPDSPPPKC